jgi:uncharacterized protein (TIGR03437 family)
MRIWKVVLPLAATLVAAPLHAQIANIKDFLKTCPDNDPAIAQIKADFAFYDNGVAVTSIPCTEPYNQMDPAKMNTELAILQSLRVMYYMDRGRSNYLPWTSLRLYDWIKSKIAGINFVPGSSFACCTTVAGKNVIFGRVLDTLSIGGYRDFTGISGGIGVIAHEARHVDGFPHVGCCPVGAGACDQSYDEKNLSPYGIQDWLAHNWLNGNINVGMFCSLSNEIRTTTQYLASENTQNRFCDTKPPVIPTMAIADTPGGACSLRTLQLATNGVANGANYVTTNLWNGSITVLFGSNIGPATPVTSPSITPQRTIATTLGNTQVFFDGVAAPMIYAYPNQLSAVAPFSLGTGGANINGVNNDYVEVQSNGKLSNIVAVQHQRSSPGIFALDGSGTGQAAALNQDFTINGAGNPAARGSVIQLFATGFGQTNPPLTDGQLNPSTPPLATITSPGVSIGGTFAQVVYAGAAPEAIAGLYQINAVIPNGIQPGDAIPVKITFGDTSNTVSIAVK